MLSPRCFPTLSRISRTFSLVLLLVLASLFSAVSAAIAQGQARSATWQRFDVDQAIQPDGSVKVIETQVIQFSGTYQQGYRLVPLDRTTGAGNVSVAEITNGQSTPYARGTGQPGTYSTSEGTNGLEIDWWFPPTTNATRTFSVQYTVAGAVRIYDAGDQLQWRAIYADRAGSVAASTVTVQLPANAPASDVKSAWYRYTAVGTAGALSPVAQGTDVDGQTVQFTLGPLDANEGAETRVQFPHGSLTTAAPAWQAGADRADWLAQTVGPIGDFVALLLTLGLLGGGGALLLLLWFSSGRDPRVGTVPRRLQEPPSSLPAPLAGTLVDEVASQRDAVATLVDLGDRGLLHLSDEHLQGSPSDVRITLDVKLDDQRLQGYELALLVGLFGPAPSVPTEIVLSSAMPRFQASIPFIEARLYEAVAGTGLFTNNPELTRRKWRSIGMTILALGILLAFAAGLTLAGAVHVAWLPGTALAVLGGCLIWLAGSMPRRTQQGALEAARWRAFAAHLADVSRGDAAGSALPAGYLAYAVAFGVDQSFVRHLESIGASAPRWLDQRRSGGIVVLPGGFYGGGPWMGPGLGTGGGPGPVGGLPGLGGIGSPGAPNPQGWSNVLAGLLSAASEAMSHGGGGGGWSGGGFGGGGGGGGGSGGFQ